jgi:hypothetical protein
MLPSLNPEFAVTHVLAGPKPYTLDPIPNNLVAYFATVCVIM